MRPDSDQSEQRIEVGPAERGVVILNPQVSLPWARGRADFGVVVWRVYRGWGWQLSHGERSRLYMARALLQGS